MSATVTTRPARATQPLPQARPRRQPAVIHPAARRLGRLFPGVTAWYGTHTRSWWAMLPTQDRLLEAPTAEALEHLVAARLLHRNRSVPPPPRPSARPPASAFTPSGATTHRPPPPKASAAAPAAADTNARRLGGDHGASAAVPGSVPVPKNLAAQTGKMAYAPVGPPRPQAISFGTADIKEVPWTQHLPQMTTPPWPTRSTAGSPATKRR
ncbi:hypothetical protein GCM10027570_46840 [Streptomonospora sediminis]